MCGFFKVVYKYDYGFKIFSHVSECVLTLTEPNFKNLQWEGSIALT